MTDIIQEIEGFYLILLCTMRALYAPGTDDRAVQSDQCR
mgnify:FL=1